MFVALLYIGVSLGILALLTFVYVLEDMHGRRLFLLGFRSFLDKMCSAILEKLRSIRAYFAHSFMRLLLHYGAHTILKRVLSWLRNLEAKVEDLVRKNKRVAKDIHAAKQKTHLDEMTEHKKETALSESEKEKMRSH